MILVDASAVIASADRRDPVGKRVRDFMRGSGVPLVISAPVTAEVDYMLGQRFGRQSRLNFLDDLERGRFRVECLEPAEYGAIRDLENRYAAFNPGLADLSIVVLAARFRTRRVLTFDERHFRAFEPLQGGRFTILPADDDSQDAPA